MRGLDTKGIRLTESRPWVQTYSRRNVLKSAVLVGVGAVTQTAGSTTASAGPSITAVFDVREYGVIADGRPHNNVANLLDCFVQAAAAGADVSFPAGVIDTSEAMAGTTVTADSGRAYPNNGGIPLPVGTPIGITGQGVGVTVLKLSAGFPRAFDFWWSADGQSYRNITISRMTIDRSNLNGLAIAPLATLLGAVTLVRGEWQTLPGVSGSAFKNARFVWFPATNWSAAKSIGMAARVVGSDVQVRNDSDSVDYTLVPGDQVQGALRDHVIVGTLQFGGSVPAGRDMTIDGLLVDDVESVNVSTATEVSLRAEKADSSPNIFVDLQRSGSLVVPSITNSVVRNVRMHGGESGAYIGGQHGCYVDECWFVDSFHDTMVDPPGNYVSANFMFGQNAWVGRVGVTRCHGRRSGDVACEIDQPWEAYEIDCTWEDAFNGVFSTSFVPPARTPAGPPTTLLAGEISASSDGGAALVGDIEGLPSGVAGSGVCQIDGELFWYSAVDDAGTKLSLLRGLNGTVIAEHATGATVTFVETHKTRIVSVRSTIRNGVVMAVPGGGRGFLQYENDENKLPLPPVSIRDADITILGGEPLPGQGIYFTGWQPDLEIDGVRFTQLGLSGSGDGSAVSWSWSYGRELISTIEFPKPRIRGRDNRVYVRGSLDARDGRYVGFEPGDEFVDVDLDIVPDIVLAPVAP